MTIEIENLNKRFETLKQAARTRLGLPDGFDSQIDIKCFNDLCSLYDNWKKGIFDDKEAEMQGKKMRKNYVEKSRDAEKKKISIKRDCRDYAIAELAMSKLNKDCLKMTAEQREEQYLKILSVVEPVSARLIAEKLSSAKKNNNQQHTDCEPKENRENAVAELILKNNTVYTIYESDAEHYKKLYPDIDVFVQFRKMQGWCESNPTKRKTKKGIKAFITNWLSSEQDAYPIKKPDESEATYDLDAFTKKCINLKYERK